MPARSAATRVVKKLADAGFTAYFAGGWVRDYLMKHPSDDIDIATSASVKEIQALFPKTIPVGVAFGIVIVVLDNFQFEVATFRKDRGYVDGRRPTSIEPATAEEDAQRRDFTINGMFWDPLREQLLDFVEGEKDIQRKIIKAIGDPHERFLEDRLRMMRAVRYSTRFDFPIEEKTAQAILAHAKTLLPAVAMERVWQEFKKMSQFAHFDEGLVALHKLELLPTIFSTLRGVSIEEIKKRVSAIEHFPKNIPTIAELLELFPGQSLEEQMLLCEYLKLSNQEKEIVSFLHHAKAIFNMPQEWQEKLEKFTWAEFYANAFSEICLEIVAAHFSTEKRAQFLLEHEKRKRELQKGVQRLKMRTPILRSEQLVQEGIAPGKTMGLLLKEAERIAINEGIEENDALIARLKKSTHWNKDRGVIR
jgi:poly(A) polymerase